MEIEPRRKPKLLLINPGADKDRLGSRRRRKSSIAQLSLPLLAVRAGDRFELEILDESVSDLDFNRPADLVGISVMTPLAVRAYAIADEFRRRGKKVVLGGMHVFFREAEAAEHADTLLVGEAEKVWDRLLADFLDGRLAKRYQAESPHDLSGLPHPRLDLLNHRAYSFANIMETGRGCPHHCQYCSVTAYWGNRYRFRPVPEVVEELAAMPPGVVTFVDDNIFGNPARARALLQAIKPLGRCWQAQSDLRVARDPELLRLAAESGCEWLFIGLETTDPENLKSMGKRELNLAGDFSSSLAAIRQAGIKIFGSFILGMDHDDVSAFARTVRFCIEQKLEGANFYIFTPYPGTPLFAQMESEGRLLHRDWSKYDSNHVVFRPKLMTPEELMQGYLWTYRNFYSLGSIWKRVFRPRRDLGRVLASNLGRRMNYRRFAEGCRD
jgi:radical SAM superfamily enzyme YgiQ (UPF0313 family)